MQSYSQECYGIPNRQNPARSQIKVNGATAYGTTATKVLYLPTVLKNEGNAMQLINSSVYGTSVLIKEDGVYAINYFFAQMASTVAYIGISLNVLPGDYTTNVDALSFNNKLMYMESTTDTDVATRCCNWTGILKAGDVVRPHNRAQAVQDSQTCIFNIAKVS